MNLTSEQTRLVRSGSADTPSWRPYTDPVAHPEWITDIEFMYLDGWPGEQYSNRPAIIIRSSKSAGEIMRNAPYLYADKSYTAVSLDGHLARRYYTGEARWEEAKVLDRYDGSVPVYKTISRWQTPRTEGLGGAQIQISLTDGRIVTLQGAWIGTAPVGYTDVIIHGPDHHVAGYYLSHVAAAGAILRHAPGYLPAIVTTHGVTSLEPYPSGGVPKNFEETSN